MCTLCIPATQMESGRETDWTGSLKMKFHGAGAWRDGDEGAKAAERAIEGGERRAGQASQPAAAHRELSIAGVPT